MRGRPSNFPDPERLLAAQVETEHAGRGPLGVTYDGVLMHRWGMDSVNNGILERGAERVELLKSLTTLATSSRLAQWEAARAELRQRHAVEELKELQLLHVTRTLQVRSVCVRVRVCVRACVCGCSVGGSPCQAAVVAHSRGAKSCMLHGRCMWAVCARQTCAPACVC